MKTIILQNADADFRRAFKVLAMRQYKPKRSKIYSDRVSVTGKLGVQQGPVLRSWDYVLKIKDGEAGDSISHSAGTVITATSTQLGSLADLQTFYSYTDPSDALITMLDVDDSEHEVVLSGTLQENPLTPVVTGNDAYWHVPVTFKLVDNS